MSLNVRHAQSRTECSSLNVKNRLLFLNLFYSENSQKKTKQNKTLAPFSDMFHISSCSCLSSELKSSSQPVHLCTSCIVPQERKKDDQVKNKKWNILIWFLWWNWKEARVCRCYRVSCHQNLTSVFYKLLPLFGFRQPNLSKKAIQSPRSAYMGKTRRAITKDNLQ